MLDYKSDLSKSLHEMISDLHAAGAVPKSTMLEFEERCLRPEKETKDDQDTISY